MPLHLPPLRLGSCGPEVQNWQRFLSEATGADLSPDGAFGPRTDHATRTWQLARRLRGDGIVGSASRGVAAPEGFIQYLQARYFTPTAGRAIDVIVIHDLEYPEKPEGAEWAAGYFAAGHRKVSAHYTIDADSIVQSVPDEHVAYHAPGANHNGIGVEHAGYAAQSREEWLDAYSRAELARSARLVARLCRTYGIPITWLSREALRGSERGITGHAEVSLAFGKSTHYDPGPGFPKGEYLKLVTKAGAA